MKKFYCYIDETGQDTKGKFFLVSIVLTGKEELEILRSKIKEIEKKTKGKSKWTKTDNKKKILFIQEILRLRILKGKVFYTIYQNTTAYTPLVAMALSKAVIRKTKKYKDEYRVNIIIDGLRKKDKQIIRKELKNLDIKYHKIKVGLKDEQEVLLRLADALAGFIRDYIEGSQYAVVLIRKEEFNQFFREI